LVRAFRTSLKNAILDTFGGFMTKQIITFSGGKDSTALALRLAEMGEDFVCLFTPTGNELPELQAHIEKVLALINKPLVLPANKSLDEWITFYEALPNWRQRWCTRQIKIEPCVAYLKQHPGSTLLVGLRADEMERQGLYGDYATYRYPLREWGWGVKEVWAYLKDKGLSIPKRTDCALCYGQRLGEWYSLWKNHPAEFARGEFYEAKTGYTFRSAGRDTWPAALKDLRAQFESGRKPRGVDDEDTENTQACRVCAL
jgi:3'-phosphoadenosine 5'-phosphosulfate sulfotransferase (PAPS reductase)/FAD synthetase